GRRDQLDAAAEPRATLGVAAGRPAQEVRTEDDPWLAVELHARAVGELVQVRFVQPPTLCVKHLVELAGARGTREREEALVIRVPALGARPVPRGECGRLVEEEE